MTYGSELSPCHTSVCFSSFLYSSKEPTKHQSAPLYSYPGPPRSYNPSKTSAYLKTRRISPSTPRVPSLPPLPITLKSTCSLRRRHETPRAWRPPCATRSPGSNHGTKIAKLLFVEPLKTLELLGLSVLERDLQMDCRCPAVLCPSQLPARTPLELLAVILARFPLMFEVRECLLSSK